MFAEVIRADGVGPLSAADASKIDGYLENDFIVWVEVDIPLGKAARDLARAHALKPGDAIHAATAIRAKCDQLLTWDANFHKGGRTIGAVFITEPHTTGWQTSML
jgi:predicted nucleic acid-binding protein